MTGRTVRRFRKKPVIVEAEQFYQSRGPWPEGVCRIRYDHHDPTSWTGFNIATLEGFVAVAEGDWIITTVKAGRYPCKPDIFAADYEEVSDDPS